MNEVERERNKRRGRRTKNNLAKWTKKKEEPGAEGKEFALSVIGKLKKNKAGVEQ